MSTNRNQNSKISIQLTISIIFSLVLSIILDSCTVGPQFIKPQIPINQNWTETDSTFKITKAIPDSSWWTVFNDSILNQLIRLAYNQNLPLQITGLKIMEARAQLAIASGRQFPQTQAALGSLTAVGLSENASDALGINRNFIVYQAGFDVSWEADFWGKFRNDVKAQAASLLATTADYNNALVSLAAEVAHTYVMIRTFDMLIKLAKQNVQLQEEGKRIAESKLRNGAGSELDVTQATTLLESTRASIPQLEINLIQSQNALSTLLGQPVGTIKPLLKNNRDIPDPPQEISIILPVTLLKRRPDIRNAEHIAAAQCARVGMAKSELYPKISIPGTIRTQSSNGTGVQSDNLFDIGSLMYTIGPQIVWPFLNYGQISNNVRVQDARLQQSLVNYQNTVLKAVQEVEDNLTGFQKAMEIVTYEQKATTNAVQSVKLALIQYREGAVDYQRVLDAQRSQLQQENSLTQARSTIITNLISLYKAFGGGWELRQGQPVISDTTRIQMQNRTNWGNLFSKPVTLEKIEASTPEDR